MTSSSGDDDEQSEPSWLDTENDKAHRQEVTPLLFGSGKVTLKDPSPAESPVFGCIGNDNDSDIKTNISFSGKPSNYGSTSSNRDSLWTIKTDLTEQAGTNAGGNNVNDNNDNEKDIESKNHSSNDYSKVIDFNQVSGRPIQPKRKWPVKLFFIIEIYAVVTCLILLISQFLPIILVPLKSFDRGHLALKVYIMIFSLIFIIVEIDHPFFTFIQGAAFLQNYSSRGFLYSFFGLIVYSETAGDLLANSGNIDTGTSMFDISWWAVSNCVAAFSMISLGVLYFLLGLFCLQRVRDKCVYEDRLIWKAYQQAMDEFTKDGKNNHKRYNSSQNRSPYK